MKKSVLAAGALLASALAMTAPSPSEAQSTNKVSMWFHSGQGSEREALNASIKRFNAANKDIQIEANPLPEGNYGDQVHTAALTNSLPCVLDFDGPNLYNYAWSGKLISINKYVTSADRRDFLPSIIRQGTYNGKLYSLGQFDSGLAIWGSKKLLAKTGMHIPTSPLTAWTGAEFLAVLAKLKAGGLPYPLDMKFNYGAGEWYSYGFAPIMQSFGGDLINRNGYKTANGTINGEAAVAGMTFFQNMVKNYANAGAKTDTDFIEGKAAFSYVGHWAFSDYKKALGDDLVLVPMPRFGGRKAVTGSGSWSFGISSDCKNPDAAGKVLQFLTSTTEALQMADANGAVPARKSSIAKSKNYANGSPLALYVDQINAGVPLERPSTPAYPAISKAFAGAVANIVTGGNVQAELDKAAKTIDQDINNNKGYPLR